MIKLKIKDKYYNVINQIALTESSREVTFNSITIDFTNNSIEDLPYKYQECQIVDENQTKLFTGYVNNFELPSLKNENEFRKLNIELLSPLAMTTKRTITAIGTYKLKNLIEKIIQPLINDGYVLKELNIGENQITVNYLLETIESALNKLSNKHKFWWYINANKEIYINNIEYLFNLKSKIKFDEKLDGLFEFTPSANAIDYCNVVNLTNLKLYMRSEIDNKPLFDTSKIIKPGDEITFNYPVDIKKENIVKAEDSQYVYLYNEIINKYLALYMEYDGGYLGVQVQNDELIFANCQIGDSTDQTQNQEWTLIKDPFFSNIITGIKYNGTTSITNITILTSCSALVWSKYKMFNYKEIEKMKGVISQTGVVEKIIDMKEQWKTYPELIDIANSYISNEETKVDQIKIKLDKDYNLKIGDIVEINKPNFFTVGKYVITDLTTTMYSTIKKQEIILRNSNYLENYIDLFRTNETEESEDKTYNEIINNYDETTIREVHEVVNV